MSEHKPNTAEEGKPRPKYTILAYVVSPRSLPLSTSGGTSPPGPPADPAAVESLCRFLGLLMWKGHSTALVQTGSNLVIMGLLNTVAFSTRLIPRIWAYLQEKDIPGGVSRLSRDSASGCSSL